MSEEKNLTMEQRLVPLREERHVISSFDRDRELAVGELSPRQRITHLLDQGSFLELNALTRAQLPEDKIPVPNDGAVIGMGTIGGRCVAVLVEDRVSAALGTGQVAAEKRSRLLNQAVFRRLPLVVVADRVPGPPQLPRPVGGLPPLYAGQNPARHVAELGTPFVAVVLGGCSGQEATLVTAADLVVASRRALSVPGALDADLVDVVAGDDQAALEVARAFLSWLPVTQSGPLIPTVGWSEPEESLDEDVLDAPGGPYLTSLVDESSLQTVRGHVPAAVVVGLARVEGHPVGVVSAHGGAALDLAGLRAVQRVAHLCHRFALPLITLQDSAGYDQSAAATAEYVHALTDVETLLRELEVPKVAIVTGQGRVLGSNVLGGRGVGYDLIWAWPTARIPVADDRRYDPRTMTDVEAPWDAADLGLLDDIIKPSETRTCVARAIRLAAAARGYPAPFRDRGMRTQDPI